MMDRLRGMLGLDAVVPVVLVAAALVLTLEPTVLGVSVSERQIVLAFFGFLGIDTLVERTGRLRRIERRLEALARAGGTVRLLAMDPDGAALASSASTRRRSWRSPSRTPSAAPAPPPAAAGRTSTLPSPPSRPASTSTWPETSQLTASCPTWQARHFACQAYAATGLIEPGEPVPQRILDAARALQGAGYNSRAV